MMKIKYLIYITILFFAIIAMSSCENEGKSYTKDIEGHWLRTETKVYISVADSSFVKSAKEQTTNLIDSTLISYEFKNDYTYYCHRKSLDPLKGKYKIFSNSSFQIEDIRGEKKLIYEAEHIYIQSDIKKDIIEKLRISPDIVKEAYIIEVFERGLSTRK